MPRVPFALVLQVSDTYLPTIHHLINGNYPGLDLGPRMGGAYRAGAQVLN
jgi:hypothetical protein